MPEHEGTDMHESSGTPPTAQQKAIADIAHATTQIDMWMSIRDGYIRDARALGVPEPTIWNRGGVI